MRAACHTIIFGVEYADTAKMLDVIRNAGFRGVELAQPPDLLCENSLSTLIDELKARDLELLGLAGGTIEEREKFLDQPGRERLESQPYLYCDGVGKSELDAVGRGRRVALHPHAFQEVHCFADAVWALRLGSRIEWLPDTAHFAIVGDPVVASVLAYPERLAAVHFNDWTPLHGRVSHRYAKGFTELGAGKVGLEKVAAEVLKRLPSSTWVVYEQHYTHSDPQTSIRASADWLRENGFDLLPAREAELEFKWPPELPESPDPAAEASVARALQAAAAGEYDQFYQRLAETLERVYGAKAVVITARSASHGSFSMLACSPKPAGLRSLTQADGLLKSRFLRAGVRKWADHREVTGESALMDWAGTQEGNWCLTLPVANSYNPNHVRLVVHVFAAERDALGKINHRVLAEAISRAADANLDDCCRTAAAMVSQDDGEATPEEHEKEFERFYKTIHRVIMERLEAGACSIFRADLKTNRLVLAYAPEHALIWRGEADKNQYLRFYDLGALSLTSTAGRQRQPMIIPDVAVFRRQRADLGQPWSPLSEETPTQGEQNLDQRALMYVPMVAPSGELMGVVRCVRRKEARPFSDDDVAVTDAVLQAAIPGLRLLQEAKDKEDSYAQLRHELKGPLVSIANIFDTLEYYIGRNDKGSLPYDFLADGRGWADLSLTLIQHMRYRSHDAPIVPRAPIARRLILLVAPVVRQLSSEFRKRRLPEYVEYKTLGSLPPLHVDPMMFQEVFFNLILNAIKYNDSPRERFELSIGAESVGEAYLVHITDNGHGVDPALADRIFEKGFRDKRVLSEDGEGYGLWIVRRMIEAHQGTISLTEAYSPTRFTIRLPRWLADRAPGGGR